ncbi:cobalamin biosynthesis protein CobW [Haloarcula taiwanensis]|uniref:Cobalamin biosynthesis protein CobW n=1 Tax=Haloarcula taiwanensis TaxID=1932004 RepID=A0A2H5A1W7_9EURY|nr:MULTISPECIES: GTP-binding protein [Haloarcula]AUG48705.1 cobalamin biosynthesis protein CobW [Haloarcula taiwanensis]RLM40037.1 GTP-binding protein [Haloarcula sp. Atlit-120R]RLM48054.1 GTP-binding protein [Haloarcula sp. Atlit-47R]
MRDTIPVTILSGSLGAGKTTLLNHLLTEAGDRDIAVLVNDMGTVNVDAELIAEGSELDVDDGVAELSNGCICCELQDDLETAVVRLANDRDFDALVVESSGISEPAPVARLFTTESRVAALYRVDTLVTVLDTRLFLDAFAGETPERRGAGTTDGDADEADAGGGDPAAADGDRPLSDLMVEQVELSNLVVLNKADLCSDAELDEAEELVGALQPDAETVRTTFSQVDPDRLFDRGLFNPDKIADLPGWKRALAEDGHSHGNATHEEDGHDHHHPEEVYGVTSFTYRRRRPFHPERLAEALRDLPASVVRSKGTVWLAGTDCRVVVGQAGPSIRAEAQGPWIASLPDIERDMYRSNRPDLDWHDEHGDRRTELVFIGTDYDEDGLRSALDDALVTDEEWGDGDPSTGPFPAEQGEETVIRSP